MPIKMTTKKKVPAPIPTDGVELKVEPDASKIPEQTATDHSLVSQVVADLTHDTPDFAPDQPAEHVIAQAAPPTGPTVMVTLPYKGQSKQFLEVVIDNKQAWLGKDSLVSFEIAGDLVEIEMTRTLAKRRKILQAA